MISTITWTLPRPPESKYKGGFPRYFERNLIALLGYPERILHPFGGMAETGVRVDLKSEVRPDVVGDAHELPFEDASFDLVVLDPPYSDEEAEELCSGEGSRDGDPRSPAPTRSAPTASASFPARLRELLGELAYAVTRCSQCNQAKGKELPEALPEVAS